MKVHVLVHENAANESRRKIEEEIEVDINDKIEDVKLKITIVYTDLET
jgi:hypothetical protein